MYAIRSYYDRLLAAHPDSTSWHLRRAALNLRETLSPREVKHLEAEAWEDFLDMCIGQCGIWAGENIEPEKKNSELMPTEPYLLGSHSGCCGIWVSGPDEAWVPEDYKVKASNGKVYNRMTTVEGLFTCSYNFV